MTSLCSQAGREESYCNVCQPICLLVRMPICLPTLSVGEISSRSGWDPVADPGIRHTIPGAVAGPRIGGRDRGFHKLGKCILRVKNVQIYANTPEKSAGDSLAGRLAWATRQPRTSTLQPVSAALAFFHIKSTCDRFYAQSQGARLPLPRPPPVPSRPAAAMPQRRRMLLIPSWGAYASLAAVC